MENKVRNALAAVLLLVAWVGLPVLSSSPPKIVRGNSPHATANWERHLREFRDLHPGGPAQSRAVKGSVLRSPAGLPTTPGPSPEAYSLLAPGFSEGCVDHVATNGSVAAWSSDTLEGNFTFAPVNDIAHPTACFVGYGCAPTYGDSMQFVGDMLYVDSGGTDILVFDCTYANAIQLVADYDVSCYIDSLNGYSRIEDFRVKNGYLWVALGADGFLTYALGNPTYPVLYGNWANECENYGLVALDPNGPFDVWCMHIEVTDDTMILIDDTPGYGYVYLWDITNMVDPIHTVLPYNVDTVLCPGRFRAIADCQLPPIVHNVALFNSPDLGFPYFESSYSGTIHHGIQVKYVSGWIFVANSVFNSDLGLARFDWQDESNPCSLMAVWGAPMSIHVAGPPWGNPRHLNNFHVDGASGWVFTSYEDVYDGVSDIAGDSGEKWDWSTFPLPTSLRTYKMDRFFFNNEPNFAPTPAGAGSYNVFYGGASIAFCSAGPSQYLTLIAGWNYVGIFDDAGTLLSHYTTGMDPQRWPLISFHTPWDAIAPPNPNSQPIYVLPAGATVWNLATTPDDAYAIVWEPEGFTTMYNAADLKLGYWECPSKQDFVRGVALAAGGQYALVSCGSLGLITVNISDPAAPVTVGTWWTNPAAPTIYRQPVTYAFVHGGYAYVQTRVIVADGNNSHAGVNVLRVLDISNPALPVEVAAYETAVGDFGGIPPDTIYWDVNHIQIANAYAAQGHEYLQISNGQGIPLGMPLEAWRPAFSNSVEYYDYSPTASGSFIIGDVSAPSALPNRFDASLEAPPSFASLLPGTYCFMSAFASPPGNSGYWAYVADGFGEAVDMTDPSLGVGATHPVSFQSGGYFPDPYGFGTLDLYGMLAFPTYVTKVFGIQGLDQLGTGYFFLDPVFGATDAFDQWDVSSPLGPSYLTPYGANFALLWGNGDWFGQLSDQTLIATSLYGDLFFYANEPDYVPPVFTTGGPNGDGWWLPYCGSFQCGVINAPMTLQVQVVDDVGVAGVRFRATYDNGDHWDDCDPGYVDLGDASGPDAGNRWSLTIAPSQFQWSGWVRFHATASDAGGNLTSEYNYGGNWYVVAEPSILVHVGPAGTDYPYVWSTTTVSAQVTPVPGDPDVARVLFMADGSSLGEGTYNPSTRLWYANWNTTFLADGNHSITAQVTTGLGGVATSAPVSRYASNSGPASTMASPLTGQSVHGVITVSDQINAAYPVPVDHVSFYLDSPVGSPTGGSLIGTAYAGASGLYAITWNSDTASTGFHTLVAVATDHRWDGSGRVRACNPVWFAKVLGYVGEASGSSAAMAARRDTGSSVHVTYAPGCGAGSHVVYWGTSPIIGALQWAGGACFADASGQLDFDPGMPDAGRFDYFVVVSQNDAAEGSYGRNSAGVERPEAVGTGVCDKPQNLAGSCP